MPKIRVKVRDAYCKKCKNVGTTDRHHLRHEKLWLNVWEKRRRGQVRFILFRRRYHRFNRKDTVRLCRDCHGEIHYIYARLVALYRYIYNRKEEKMSWKEANHIMDKMKDACSAWLS